MNHPRLMGSTEVAPCLQTNREWKPLHSFRCPDMIASVQAQTSQATTSGPGAPRCHRPCYSWSSRHKLSFSNLKMRTDVRCGRIDGSGGLTGALHLLLGVLCCASVPQGCSSRHHGAHEAVREHETGQGVSSGYASGRCRACAPALVRLVLTWGTRH